MKFLKEYLKEIKERVKIERDNLKEVMKKK